jgi:3-phosphoshikimate 1-carboxyvinyltransferase
VLAANCSGTSRIKGTGRLKQKESNRAAVLAEEFSNLNIGIELKGDDMLVTGGPIKGGEISSRNDHRMAMAGAVAAINAEAEVSIRQAESVSKSYPEFFKDIQKVGGKIESEN